MKINVVYNADNWVIGYWGKKMCECFAVVDIDIPVNFYVPYSAFNDDWCKHKDIMHVAYFTHNSFDGKFEDIAKKVDLCVCQAPQYERYLKSIGIKNVVTIPAPPDEKYVCKLNLAWIGHFFWAERKGIDLFNKVKELEFVNLIFNEHAQNLSLPPEGIEKIQECYDKCDYVLITSRFEGGPMCLVEGLKCGKKVICPLDVGNAEMFKNGVIPYKNSDWDSLYSVLNVLYKKKMEIANIVKSLNWNSFTMDLVKNLSYFVSSRTIRGL